MAHVQLLWSTTVSFEKCWQINDWRLDPPALNISKTIYMLLVAVASKSLYLLSEQKCLLRVFDLISFQLMPTFCQISKLKPGSGIRVTILIGRSKNGTSHIAVPAGALMMLGFSCCSQ